MKNKLMIWCAVIGFVSAACLITFSCIEREWNQLGMAISGIVLILDALFYMWIWNRQRKQK